jgi:hypothetical protein
LQKLTEQARADLIVAPSALADDEYVTYRPPPVANLDRTPAAHTPARNVQSGAAASECSHDQRTSVGCARAARTQHAQDICDIDDIDYMEDGPDALSALLGKHTAV